MVVGTMLYVQIWIIIIVATVADIASEKGVNSIKYRTVKLLTLQTIQLSSHYYMSIIIMCGRYIMIMLLSPNCIVCRVSVNHVRFKLAFASNAFLACLLS
jgi:hypothetical protein